mmetsp:Transcript_29236/g.56599  ORF Transcript_29236/g.56599 Transcript_29236/m.56599 type:complete len:228 (+) Transcript_29236:1608-2291(+)
MTGDLEQPACVTIKVNRHHSRVGFCNHPRGKTAPSGIHRSRKGLGRRADRAARENPDGPVITQIAQRLFTCRDVQGHRRAGVVKTDRQQHPVQLFGLFKDRVRQKPEIAPDHRQDMPHHQPVENAVGVICDQDQRLVARDVIKATAHNIQGQAIAFHHHLPEIAPRRDFILIAFRAFDQPQTPGRVLQQTDHRPPAFCFGGMGIADLARDLAFCVWHDVGADLSGVG